MKTNESEENDKMMKYHVQKEWRIATMLPQFEYRPLVFAIF